MRSFVHLHNHTHGSVLDGLQTPAEMVAAAVEDGQPAIAVTDHGTMAETLSVAKAAEKAGVKPILGIEAYLALGDEPEARLHQHVIYTDADYNDAGDEPGKQKRKTYEHLTILARNAQGWESLCRLSAIANSSGKFYSADGKQKAHLHGRIDMASLEAHRDGLIVLTGCIGGPVAGRLNRGDVHGAERWLERAVEIFGTDNVFVEVMDHGNPDQRKVIPELVRLARKFGLRTVATNDSHYSHDCQYDHHDAWLAAQTGRSLADPARFGHWHPHHSVRSAEAMRSMFDTQPGTEDACDSTLLIADQVEPNIIPFAAPAVPPFTPPSGFATALDWFKHLLRHGAAARYGDPLPDEARERINFEAKVIVSKGFVDYFCILHELIGWERSQGGRIGPGRGSAGGSAIAYCLGITDVDPIRWGLLFERFLHPERSSMPDIDTDFEPHRRDAIFQHLKDTYGDDRFARIGTLGTVKARAAILRAAKVLDAPSGLDRTLSNAVPPNVFGRSVMIAEALDPSNAQGAELQRLANSDELSMRVLELAKGFENRIANEGIHACGVVVADRPLADFVPLRYTKDGTAVTQVDDKGVEALGLVKFDVLGLINLSVIREAVEMIPEAERPDVDHLPWNGPDADKVWSMIAAGDTVGVFQLGNSGMRELSRRLIPRTPDDLFALLALYRPGPMASGLHYAYADRRNGREEVNYDALTDDPVEADILAGVLGDTYGVLVFQEAILRMAQEFAGWSKGDSDSLRKAVGKKLRSEMEALKERFVSDCQKSRPGFIGFSERTSENVWSWIEANADYSFNKSHTVQYGHVAWMTAWLKCHHPVEYATALLRFEEDPNARLELFSDMTAHGIGLLLPDVNRSQAHPTPEGGAVRLGLGGVSGVKEAASEIVEVRETGGPFTSLFDLVSRCGSVKSDTAEALVRAGACDEFGPRLGLIVTLTASVELGRPVAPFPTEWTPIQRLHHEHAALGVYVSGHPLLTVPKAELRSHLTLPHRWPAAVKISELRYSSPNEERTTVGVVVGYSQKYSKRGNPFAKFRLDGPSGQIEVVAFSNALSALSAQGIVLSDGMIVRAAGQVTFQQAFSVDGSSDDSAEPIPQLTLATAAVYAPEESPGAVHEPAVVYEPPPVNEPVVALEMTVLEPPIGDAEERRWRHQMMSAL